MTSNKITKRSHKTEVLYPPVNQSLVKVLTDFIRNQTNRFGIKKCVIGLSGGIDSATSAYIAVKALGKKNVTGILLPYKLSSPESIRDALTIIKKLGIHSAVINISKPVDALTEERPKIDKIRKGNIIARMRMICLYDYSKQVGGFVLGTGNKTEILLGYTTLFGDSACAINPLGDLYKTQILKLAELLKIPKQIIKKKPSADLWKGQTDEGELGFTYKEADKLLFCMIDCGYSDEKLIAEGFKPALIKTVKEKIRKNRFKSLPAPIAKVTTTILTVS